jgi:hypothetical protein
MPRHNYFNNFIKDNGYELSREKGFYCLIQERCNSNVSLSSFQFNTTFGRIDKELYFKNDWVKASEHLIPDYSQISSSSIIFDPIVTSMTSDFVSQAKTFPILYGFIGGDKVKVELKQNANNYTNIKGSYYSTSENKTYKLSGRINSNVYNSTGYNGGNISMNEFENDSVSGKVDIYADKPTGINGGYSFGLSFDTLLNDPSKLKKLFGNYTATDGTIYDLYLTQDENEINNWKTETFSGKLYNNNASGQSIFMKVGDKYYFSKNFSKFKDIPNESEITITAKTRPSYQGEYYMDKKTVCYGEGGCGGQPGFNSKDLMFGISDVKVIEKVKPVAVYTFNSAS